MKTIYVLLLVLVVGSLIVMDLLLKRAVGNLIVDGLAPLIGFILGFAIARTKAKKKEKMIVAPFR